MSACVKLIDGRSLLLLYQLVHLSILRPNKHPYFLLAFACLPRSRRDLEPARSLQSSQQQFVAFPHFGLGLQSIRRAQID